MNIQDRRSTAFHESGHCVSAWTFGVEMHAVNIRETEEHYGVTYFKNNEADDITCAVIMTSGEIAARIALGGRGDRERFNWLAGGCDAEKARWFCDQTSRPLLMRQLVELKASSLLRTRWRAVEAIAEHLERRTLILPADIDRLCRAAGARKAGEHRTRPFNPDTRMVVLPGGKHVTMRTWAHALDANSFDKEKAEKVLGATKGEGNDLARTVGGRGTPARGPRPGGQGSR
jgi:hypothetical protein